MIEYFTSMSKPLLRLYLHSIDWQNYGCHLKFILKYVLLY